MRMHSLANEPVIALGVACFAFAVVPLYAVSLRVFLALRRGAARDAGRSDFGSPPEVTVILPVLNESGQIRDKLRNLFEQEYPIARLRILVVDGGSSDGTQDIARAQLEARGGMRFDVLRSPDAGKIPQLNYALARVASDGIVVVTDADARIKTTRALGIAVRLLGARHAGVVGGYARPAWGNGMRLSEWIFWTMQNWVRATESSVFSSNIAVAPFYAFRRDLLDRFPEGCVADDVYVSFVAHQKRRRVLYTEQIPVVELRSPGSFSESLRHKMRKIHAYHLELFRFLPTWGAMRPSAALGCAVRLAFFFGWPAGAVALAWSLSQFTDGFSVGLVALVFLAYALLVLGRLARVFRKENGRELPMARAFFALAELFILLVLASFAGLVGLLVWKQSSNYWRVSGGEPSPA